MKTFLLLFCICLGCQLYAQTNDYRCYEQLFKEGMDCYNKQDYNTAYFKFRAARYGCKPLPPNVEETIENWINKAQEAYVNALREEQKKTLQALKKADSLLKVAQENQAAMEFACFRRGTSVKPRSTSFQSDELEKIDSLDLSDNNLKSLPEEVWRCRNLKQINLLGNSDLCWKTTFEILLQLPNLEEIKLQTHHFDSIPKELYSKIKTLDLSKSKLKVLPPEIGQLENLILLNLTINQLQTLPMEISQLKKLKLLFLGYNKINILPPEIVQLKDIIELDLQSNPLKMLPIEIINLKAFDADNCGSWSWKFLECKDYEKALLFAQKGIEKDSTETWIYSNLTWGYLFTNQYNKAEEIVLRWKSKTSNNGDNFKEVFTKDIDDLEKQGITHPDIAKIRKLLE